MPRVAVIAALLALGSGAAAWAGDPAAPPLPTLKRAAVVSADVVRIGDLIDGAGPAAGIAIFRAPDIGETGSVPAYQVLAAARVYGIERIDTQGNSEVAVTRAGRLLGAKEIEAAIARTLLARGGVADAHDLSVTFDREPEPLHLQSAADLRALYTYYNARSGRFDITFEAADETARRSTQRYSGYAVETLPVAVTLRPLARGEIVKAADVAIEHRPKAEFREHTGDGRLPNPVERRTAWFEGTGPVDTPVYQRDHLPAGTRLDGPAVVEQLDSTTVVAPGAAAEVDRFALVPELRRDPLRVEVGAVGIVKSHWQK